MLNTALLAVHLEVTGTGLQLPEALAKCQDYDTIVVRGGPFEFTPLLPTSEAWQNPNGGAALTLANRKGVRIIGENGALLRFTPGSGLCIMDCQDIELTGLTFQGPGYTLTPEKWYCALVLLAGTNSRLHIHDCGLWEACNHGIGHLMSGSTNDSIFEHNICLRGGHLSRPSDIHGEPALGGDGAALAVRGSRNRFAHNLITDWLRGIEIEAKSNEASNNIVEYNELRNVFWHGIMVTPTGGDPDQCRRNVIRHNRITSGPGMGNFRMAHPIYVSGGLDQSVEDNVIHGKDGDWCGVDGSPDHCDLSIGVYRNRIFGMGRFGVGFGFNGPGQGVLNARAYWNRIDRCQGAAIGYRGKNVKVFSNRIGEVLPRDGVQTAIYAPDDPQLSYSWDNVT